jgi:hypothetical protein
MGLSCFPELASECFREAVGKQQEARPVRFGGLAPSKPQPRKTRTVARVGRQALRAALVHRTSVPSATRGHEEAREQTR